MSQTTYTNRYIVIVSQSEVIRTENITNQKWNVGDIEIEIVVFVINGN